MEQKRVLLIDDDLFLRELYAEELTRQGYALQTGINGNEAIVKIKEGKWDLVLLDIIMPELSGIEVIKKLKAESAELYYKRLVFLTNLEEKEELEEAEALGDGYIIKSQFTPDEFIANVSKFLS